MSHKSDQRDKILSPLVSQNSSDHIHTNISIVTVHVTIEHSMIVSDMSDF